ncbi:MAG: hypothetical protein ACN4GZ_07545 [Acidimicrobiales bacterium]
MNSQVTPTPRTTCVSFHSAKGGVGTSVVAAATAVLSAERQETLLVDLAGDQGLIFGAPPVSATLSDWFATDAPHPDSLARLARDVAPQLKLLAVEESGCLPRAERLRTLAQILRSDTRAVVIDLGRMRQAGVPLIQAADRSYLVTRPCYLAVRAAMSGPTPDGVIIVSEKGRSLRAADVSSALGSPAVAQLWIDPTVARAVDAGLLANRLPRSLRRLEELL